MANVTVSSSQSGPESKSLPGAVQGSKTEITLYWKDYDGTPVVLTGATLSAKIKNSISGTTYIADGVFAVTDEDLGIFTWTYGDGDVGQEVDGVVQFAASYPGPVVIYSSSIPWKVEENLTADSVASAILVGVTTDEAAWLTAAEGTGNALEDYLLIADSGEAGSIDNMSDVTIDGTPADNEVLAYDGGSDQWINQTPAEAGLLEAEHSHPASDIDSGTLADARIAESNVTQHQSALVITESQVSDLDKYTQAEADAAIDADIAAHEGTNTHAQLDTHVADVANPHGVTAAQAGAYTQAEADAAIAADIAAHEGTNTHAQLDTHVADAANPHGVTAEQAGALPTAGGTMAGDIAMADNEVQRAVLKDTGEAGEIDASSTATKTLDIAAQGNNFDITLDSNCTFTFSNPSASGTWCFLSLILRQDGTGSRTVTWPGSVDWGDAGAPTLKTGASDIDMFTFLTVDAGTTWLATTLYGSELADHIAATAAHGATGAVVGTTNTQTLTNKTLGGVTLSGAVTGAAQNVNDVVLKDYGEDTETDATSTATKTLDIAAEGNVFDITLTANCTFTFSNPSASGTACSITLICRQDGTGSRTVTWPASVDWASATAPTLSTGASDVDVFTFLTVDAGTIWLGFTAGLDMS